jgi:hypothetical protein
MVVLIKRLHRYTPFVEVYLQDRVKDVGKDLAIGEFPPFTSCLNLGKEAKQDAKP